MVFMRPKIIKSELIFIFSSCEKTNIEICLSTTNKISQDNKAFPSNLKLHCTPNEVAIAGGWSKI